MLGAVERKNRRWGGSLRSGALRIYTVGASGNFIPKKEARSPKRERQKKASFRVLVSGNTYAASLNTGHRTTVR